MKFSSTVIVVLSSLVFLAIILGNYRILVFNNGYYLDELQGSVAAYQYNSSFVEDVVSATIDFHKGNGNRLSIYFNQQEMSHLSDVKSRIAFFNYLFYFSISALAVILFTLLRQEKNFAQIAASSAAWGSAAVLAVAAFISIASSYFSQLFTGFHIIFFPSGNWAFPESSLLVTVFNEKFFYSFLYRIALNSAITAAVLLAASLAFLHGKKWLRQ